MRNKIIALLFVTALLAALAACAGGQAPTASQVQQAAPTVAAAVQKAAEAAPTVAAAAKAAAPTVAAAAQQAAPTVAAAAKAAAPTVAAAAKAAAPTAAAAAAGGGKTYVLVPKNLGNPYFDTANKGAQEAAKELGVTVTYQGPATADATQQIQLLNSLIAQNPGGLAISADDSDALVPVGKTALGKNIPVVSFDSAIAPGGRTVHVNQANSEDIGRGQIQLVNKLLNGKGKIAILSATSTAPNQNKWIEYMKDELKKPENSGLELVATVYGDDQDEKSYNEAQGLLKTYPDLKAIIAPTTVGIAASARAVTDANKIGQVAVTGLGTPNQMRQYVKNGASPAFALWNPADLGYLTIQALNAIANGKIQGKPGDKFTAGRLGDYTVDQDGNILLGKPTVFDKSNIDNFNF
ncbi:MAG: rhamnose ABC transporter substrate-binding protein [Anaerolineae bacterium]